MQELNHGYPVGQYKEYNDLGTYFAYLRHELITKEWAEHASRKETIATVNIMATYALQPDLSKYGEIARLDRNLYECVNGNSINILRGIVDYHKDLLENEFWVEWTRYINSLLDLLTPASEIIHQWHIREDLHYVYNEQFNRLTQRLGTKEFASIIGWSQRQLAAFRSNGDNFPPPVEILGATPVWTLGQAENFLRIINARKALKIRGDWSSMQKQDISWRMGWQKVELECLNPERYEDEKPVYTIHDSALSYSYATNSAIAGDSKFEKIEAAGSYIAKRLKYCPDTFYAIGDKFLRSGDLTKAEQYLELARTHFESVVSLDLDGFIDSNEEHYFYTYYLLSYIKASKGELEESTNLMTYIQTRVNIDEGPDINFEEDLNVLFKSPENFVLWMRERNTFLVDEGPAPSLPNIPGADVNDLEDKKKILVEYRKKGWLKTNLVFNGWTRFHVHNTLSGDLVGNIVSLDFGHEFDIELAQFKELSIGESHALLIIDPKAPKLIYILGPDRDETEKIALEWRAEMQACNSDLAEMTFDIS